MACKAQTGTAANHEPQLIGETVLNCLIIRQYRCALCGELDEDVIGYYQYPEPDKSKAITNWEN